MVKAYKRKKSLASLIINSQPEIKDDKLSMGDTSNNKDKSKTWL